MIVRGDFIEMEKKYWESTKSFIPDSTRTILNEYLLGLKLANKSEATIIKYRSILEQFFRECSIPLEDLKTEDVREWLNQFSIDKKEKTIDLYLSALSSFFQFCFLEDYVKNILVKKRWRPKIPQPLPKFLTEQEYAKVKLAAESFSLRDRALILFLFSSGCRRSEVSNLTRKDIDVDKRTAEVKGKGKKIRQVHFSVECALVLKDYLKTRENDDNESLFITRFGNQLLSSGVYQVIKNLGMKAELTQSLHPHVCRHTFATNMLARGADLEFIADEMGHANLNTTRIYARIPTEDMILAYQNIMG